MKLNQIITRIIWKCIEWPELRRRVKREMYFQIKK